MRSVSAWPRRAKGVAQSLVVRMCAVAPIWARAGAGPLLQLTFLWGMNSRGLSVKGEGNVHQLLKASERRRWVRRARLLSRRNGANPYRASAKKARRGTRLRRRHHNRRHDWTGHDVGNLR